MISRQLLNLLSKVCVTMIAKDAPRVLMCGTLSISGGVSAHSLNLYNELKKLNLIIYFFNYSGKDINSLSDSKWRRLYKRTLGLFLFILIHRSEFNLLHIQASGGLFSFLSAINGALISKLFSIDLVVTFHYSQTESFLAKYKKIFSFVLRNSKNFLVVSNRQRNLIASSFPEFSNKIFVIPNGFNSEYFHPMDSLTCKKLLKLPENKKIILNISNLISTKGHKNLISAIKLVSNTNTNIICIIVGRGNLENELKTQIETLGLSNFVILAGWRPDVEIPLWINACDIFVLPSLAEGNPIVMFECLGCGKPFLGTKVGGIPEIISSDNIGLLVDAGDINNLCNNILISIEKDWSRELISGYGSNFSWNIIAKKMKEIYEG